MDARDISVAEQIEETASIMRARIDQNASYRLGKTINQPPPPLGPLEEAADRLYLSLGIEDTVTSSIPL